MDVMSAEQLREPEQLYEPTSYERQAAEVRGALTQEGMSEIMRQIMEAVDRSRESGSLRPLNVVVESWYRTLVFLQRDGFEEKWNAVPEMVKEGSRLSLEDIQKRRAQRVR
jgi:hypothetical protein